MRFSIQKAQLVAAVETVGRFVKPRAPLPILQNLLFDVHPDHGLVMMGTDLDTGIRHRVPAAQIHLDGGGAATVCASALKDILKKLPGGNVDISSEEDGPFEIRAGKFQCEVPTLPALEFPSWPNLGKSERFSLERGALRSLVERVEVAAADVDEARPVMTGLLVLAQESQLTVVATDGRRLARAAQELPEEEGRDARCVVPARFMKELSRLLKGADEDTVTVYLAESQIAFEWNGTEMSCRLLEGTFPDFNRVIPKSFSRSFRCPTDEFRSALNRMLPFGREKDSPDLVRFEFDPGAVQLSAHSDAGRASEQFAGIFEGEPLVIAFNGRYLLDGLDVLGTEECELRLQDESHSAVLRRPDDAQGDYVVMPVRLREAFPEAPAVDQEAA